MKTKYLTLFVLSTCAANSYAAEQISFPKLWEMVVKNSPSTKALLLEKEASEKSTQRLSKYYLPSFYANSNLIATNDPGLTFMNFLDEGQVRQDDFIPSNLNSPSSHVFNQSNVGFDYLIYDSGSRSSFVKSQEHQSKSLDYEQKLILLNQYVRTFHYFSSFILEINQENELKMIENNLTAMMKKYRVGEKSNPV